MKLLLLFILSASAWAQQSSYTSEGKRFTFEKVLSRSEVIWGLTFLPDGRMLFTERTGKMFLFDEGQQTTTEVRGLPKVHAGGQGGLLDVKAHPDFKTNFRIYFTYSEPVGEKSTTAVAMAELKGQELVNLKKIFSAERPNDHEHHYGSRLVFDGKGHIFFGVGDRGEQDRSQDLGSHQGKMIRLNEDGGVPKDNPFVGKEDALPAIWSYGHRNPQGIALHPETGALWEAEFGPQGGDEVNLVEPGKNYGWPVITYGREYTGPKIGEGTHKAGMEQPLIHWVPSISPSGIAFYTGGDFPAWKGSLFLACLGSQHLHRVPLQGTKALKQEILLRDQGLRFRHVTMGPDGLLYVTTDEGHIGRIRPVNRP